MKTATLTRTWILDFSRFREENFSGHPEIGSVHLAVDTLNKFLGKMGLEVRFVNECNPVTPANQDSSKGYFEIVDWNERRETSEMDK